MDRSDKKVCGERKGSTGQGRRLNSRSGCAGQRQVRVGMVRVMTTMVVVVVGNTVVGSRSAGAFAAAEVAAARSTSH